MECDLPSPDEMESNGVCTTSRPTSKLKNNTTAIYVLVCNLRFLLKIVYLFYIAIIESSFESQSTVSTTSTLSSKTSQKLQASSSAAAAVCKLYNING